MAHIRHRLTRTPAAAAPRCRTIAPAAAASPRASLLAAAGRYAASTPAASARVPMHIHAPATPIQCSAAPVPVREVAAQRSARRFRQLLAVVARAGGPAEGLPWEQERLEFQQRERILLSELTAVRRQVDSLLSQQQVLINMFAASGATLKQAAAHTAQPTSPLPELPVRQRPATQQSAQTRVNKASMSNSSEFDAVNSTGGSATSLLQLFEEWGMTPAESDPQRDPTAAAIQQAVNSAGADNIIKADAPVDLPQQAAGPVNIKPAVGGQPPELSEGEDDIYWMDRLHTGLMECGFSSGDEEIGVFEFGQDTKNALLYFQASAGVPETGVADRATWDALLGQQRDLAASIRADIASGRVPGDGSGDDGAPPDAPSTPKVVAKPTSAVASVMSPGNGDASANAARMAAAPASAKRPLTKWPVVQDGDGGPEVHALQLALSEAGYFCGEDDMQWWQMGDSTRSALQCFQESVGLPASGVCDERTWKKLIGDSALPSSIDEYVTEASASTDFNEDMTDSGSDRVWLLGEGRWEVRRKD